MDVMDGRGRVKDFLKEKVLPYRVMGDGREICSKTSAGKKEYFRRKLERWVMDKGLCCLCGQPIVAEQLTYEHPNGRGFGGGTRDDRVEKCRVSHYFGNMAKGSMHLDDYLKKPLSERIRNCTGIFGGRPW